MTLTARHRKIIFIALTLFALPVQASSWGTWTDLEATKKFGIFSFSLSGGLRTQNDLKNIDRWSAGLEVTVKPLKVLELSAAYDYLYSYNMEEKENKYDSWQEKDDDGNISTVTALEGYNLHHPSWRSKNRWSLGVTYKLPVSRLTLSLREKYQITRSLSDSYTNDKYRIDDETGEMYLKSSERKYKGASTSQRLRSRLTAEYNLPHSHFSPYIYGEIFNDLASSMRLAKTRVGVGVEYKISRNSKIEAGYVWQNDNGDDDETTPHVIDISYKFKF